MKKIVMAALLLTAPLAAGWLHADPAVYLLGGIDGKVLTNQDADNYFNLPGGQLGPKGYGGGVVHLGVQFSRWMALEASINAGPVRDNDVTYENGFFGTTRHVTARWALTTYSITPAITWAGPHHVNMLGLRLGQAVMAGHVNDTAYGADGSYDQEARAFDGGLIFRSSQIMLGHLSLGFEFGYDWTMFKNIQNSNGTGAYSSVASPERNISDIGHNGDQTTLDFSGGHVAIVLGLWSNAPANGGSVNDTAD
jgi:hypothetical protein